MQYFKDMVLTDQVERQLETNINTSSSPINGCFTMFRRRTLVTSVEFY